MHVLNNSDVLVTEIIQHKIMHRTSYSTGLPESVPMRN